MAIVLDNLDEKLLDHAQGYVVKKDLGRQLKVGANVPSFVLEYLLANSCSTADEEKIEEGMANVKNILREHYVSPDEGNVIQSKIREERRYTVIDKIEARLDSKEDKYRASMFNSGIKNANISANYVIEHEKLLMGGIWAITEVIYDPEIVVRGKKFPFVIDDIKPIQLSKFDENRVRRIRSSFSRDEWTNALLRSMGYEPESEGVTERRKFLLLARLIPLVEQNFNLIELGPRQTGKSYVYRELSPYAQLISGGQATEAQLFVNNATKQIGLVGLWDTVAFDEVAGITMKNPGTIQIMKDYMESGSFSRGGSGELSGRASMVFNGNINQSVESLLMTSHLFQPLDESMIDTALLDRLHFYSPGWEMIKFSQKNFTDHFGFSVDFFAELLRSLRKDAYSDEIEKQFIFGSHLRQRDAKAVKKTVSGFIKLLHPDGDYTKDELREYIELGMEMRRRVKEQLKRIGGMEFWDTNFSYIDAESREEFFVDVPEERGSQLIPSKPLSPGEIYTIATNDDGHSLVYIEVNIAQGNGRLNTSGSSKQDVKQNIKNVYQFIKANESKLLTTDHSLKNYDITIQLSPKIGKGIGTGFGSAVFVGIMAAIHKKTLKPGLGVIGDMSVSGGIIKADQFPDMVAMLSENGAKTVLVPMDNLKELENVPQSLLAKTDTPFYTDSEVLLQKALLDK